LCGNKTQQFDIKWLNSKQDKWAHDTYSFVEFALLTMLSKMGCTKIKQEKLKNESKKWVINLFFNELFSGNIFIK